MKTRALLYGLMAVQLLGLVALYSSYEAGLHHETVMLRTAPVDPRDLLRGDYIILRYEISSLPSADKQHFNKNTLSLNRVYVELEQDEEGFSVIKRVTQYPPPSGTLFLEAQLRNGSLTYDMEKFFVPEGMGTPQGVITVKASVSPLGKAQIKELYVDGKPYP